MAGKTRIPPTRLRDMGISGVPVAGGKTKSGRLRIRKSRMFPPFVRDLPAFRGPQKS